MQFWNRWKAACIAAIAVLGAVGPVQARADVTYSDGTFNDSAWTLVSTGVGNGGNPGVATAGQIASGGNTGSYRRVTLNINAAIPGSYSTVVGISLATGAVYTPATQGGIGSLDFSEDARVSPSALGATAAGYVARQAGNYYFTPYFLVTSSAWTHDTMHIAAADFGLFTSSPNIVNPDFSQHPDFTTAGAPLQFGFVRVNSNDFNGGSYQNSSDTDNWSVTVNTAQTPEPGALALLAGASSTGLALFLRRRHRLVKVLYHG